MRSLAAFAALLAAGLAACGGAEGRKPYVVVPGEPERLPPQIPLEEVVFDGMCDASGAVPLSNRVFVVADDEDNILRTYDAEKGGDPIAARDVSSEIGLPMRGKTNPRSPEMDLEGGTLLGDRAFWISSHGNNKKGKRVEERLHFFATTVPTGSASLELVGHAYHHLLDDLVAAPQLQQFGLDRSAALAPKAPGGFNIEGLTSTPDGHLIIGFRSPVPDGKALLVPILNPNELVDGTASRAELGEPILLDLGGQGIRSLSWWRDRYLIAAGEAGDGGVTRILSWDGDPTHALAVSPIRLAIYNTEGFFTPDGRDEIMVLSDDGGMDAGGVPCKKADVSKKHFRGVWIPVP
jgi:hypothetical protein